MSGIEIVKQSSDTTPYSVFYANSHRAGTYAAYVRGKRCGTLKGLLCELSAAFHFPAYFGENWDALDECLCDLDWLCFERIALVVDSFEAILPFDRKGKQTLLAVLQTAVDHWQAEGIAFDVYIFEDRKTCRRR